MREAKRIEGITEVAVADVHVGSRLRPVSENGVAALIASIEELGVMKDPIQVRKVKHRNGQLELMAGAHRLEAAQRLGWVTLPATVWDCDDSWAQLMEIDDNCAQQEMTALDTAVFLAARKRVYEERHPETRRGTAGASARWDATEPSSVASFVSTTADKFNLSERQVYKIVAAGDRLDPRDLQLLRRAPRQTTLKDLTEIGKLGDPVERYHVVEALSEGRAKSAAEARRQWRTRDQVVDVPDPNEVAARKLIDAWSRAPMVAKRRLVEAFAEDVAELLAEARDE